MAKIVKITDEKYRLFYNLKLSSSKIKSKKTAGVEVVSVEEVAVRKLLYP